MGEMCWLSGGVNCKYGRAAFNTYTYILISALKFQGCILPKIASQQSHHCQRQNKRHRPVRQHASWLPAVGKSCTNKFPDPHSLNQKNPARTTTLSVGSVFCPPFEISSKSPYPTSSSRQPHLRPTPSIGKSTTAIQNEDLRRHLLRPEDLPRQGTMMKHPPRESADLDGRTTAKKEEGSNARAGD